MGRPAPSMGRPAPSMGRSIQRCGGLHKDMAACNIRKRHMPISRQHFGTTSDGAMIDRYTLMNAHGLEADIMTYGGTLTALRVPDRDGALGDVVLGFATLAPYLGEHPYFGALIGRYGHRIANGRFELNGATHDLARNHGPNHLHGRPDGFHRQVA